MVIENIYDIYLSSIRILINVVVDGRMGNYYIEHYDHSCMHGANLE